MTIMNFVTPKAGTKHELLFNEPTSVCWTSKSDLSSTTKCDQIHDDDCCEFGHTYDPK